jgi:hypothetical protein
MSRSHQLAMARAASAAARKREAPPIDRPAVFVVRAGHALRWEIRQFGGVVLLRGEDHFSSVSEARRAGEAELSMTQNVGADK